MRFSWRGRSGDAAPRHRGVVLTDETGRVLKPWEVRAGMLIAETRYSHNDQAVVCVVEQKLNRREAKPLPLSVVNTEGRRRHA